MRGGKRGDLAKDFFFKFLNKKKRRRRGELVAVF